MNRRWMNDTGKNIEEGKGDEEREIDISFFFSHNIF
jgi:hypothetical protein